MAQRYVNPVPGGRLGRTDQGVDISAPPGTPVRAITDEQLIGIVPNWFKGQPFYYFRELGTGVINYVAEQFRSNLKVGQRVSAGQQIGTVAPSGTGLELGFATNLASARSGHPTPGYREGQATPLGGQYRAAVFGDGSTSGRVPPGPADWLKQAHWPAALIPTMVAIGGAESRWRVDATHTNSDGSVDNGWLQINSVHKKYDQARLRRDPVYTAEAALDIYHQEGLQAWATFTSGAYKRFLGVVPRIRNFGGGGNNGITRPGGQTPGASEGPDVPTVLKGWNDSSQAGNGPPDPGSFFSDLLGAVTGPVEFLKLLAWIINPVNILRMVEFLIGFALMAFGVQAMLQAYGERREGFITSESPLSRSGLGRVSREIAAATRKTATKGRSPSGGPRTPEGTTSRRSIRPQAAPHRTRRQALRLRYEREKSVSQRRTVERRSR